MATTYSSKPPSMPSAPSVGSRPSVSTTAPSTRPRARPTTATPVSQERGRGSVYSGLGSRPAPQDNNDDNNKNKSFFERLRDTWRNSGGKDNDNLKDPREPKPMSIAPRERDEDGSSVYTSDAFTVQPSSTRVKPLPALPEVAVEELEPDTESTQLAIRKATEQTLGIMQIQEYLDKIKKEQEKTELKTPDFVVETPKEETAKKGLMAKPYDPDRMKDINEPLGEGSVSPDEELELKKYKEEYAETYLAKHEGTVAHKSLEGGKTTGAYGVKFSLGLDRDDYSSDSEFAAAVALKHKEKVAKEFTPENWSALSDAVKYALVDLSFNTGSIGTTAQKESDVAMLENTLKYIGMTTKEGEKASLISLAARRAWNWNKAADDIGQPKIAKVKQIPTGSGGTKFEYLDKDDNVVYSVTTSRKPVKISSSGSATTLTKTREVSL